MGLRWECTLLYNAININMVRGASFIEINSEDVLLALYNTKATCVYFYLSLI